MEGGLPIGSQCQLYLFPSTLLFITFKNANTDILESLQIITNHDANTDNLVVQLLSLWVQLLRCE